MPSESDSVLLFFDFFEISPVSSSHSANVWNVVDKFIWRFGTEEKSSYRKVYLCDVTGFPVKFCTIFVETVNVIDYDVGVIGAFEVFVTAEQCKSYLMQFVGHFLWDSRVDKDIIIKSIFFSQMKNKTGYK